MSFTPKHLETQVDWRSADVADPADWTLQLTPADQAEIDMAVRSVQRAGLDILEVGLVEFPLPGLAARLDQDALLGRVDEAAAR